MNATETKPALHRSTMLHRVLVNGLLSCLLLPTLTAQGEAPSVEKAPKGLDAKAWDRFHDYPELIELSKAIAARWPKFCKIESIGKSAQGRSIWALTVTNPDTGPASSKPAMYVDANIHGNEVQGSEVSLYMIWYMLRFAPSVEKLAKLRDRLSFYVLPTVNPDGRAYWFQAANNASSSRGGQIPTDNDGDGLFDEDPPNDLDGDGQLTMMRKKVPLGQGQFKISSKDPRQLVRVQGDEKGNWIYLGQEGIDDDGDGRVNEDGPGGYDPNRDWGSAWSPSWLQWGARRMPFALPESRAVRDFLLARPNIAGVQAFHNNGGMILRGPGEAGSDYPAADVRVYDEIGRTGEKMLPYYRYMVIWKDLYQVWGGFVDWTYLGLGVISFTNELWTNQRKNQAPERLSREDSQQWNDLLTFDSHRVPWKKFQHPQYGEIEIGGSTKDTGRIPPGFLIREMLHRNAAFVLYQASELPELVVEPTTVEAAGSGLSYVTITLRNKRLTPTRSAQAIQHKIGRPDLLELSTPRRAKHEGAQANTVQILAVAKASMGRDRYRPWLAKPLAKDLDPKRIFVEGGIPSRGRISYRYLVRGKGTLRFHYRAEKAKDLVFDVSLNGK